MKLVSKSQYVEVKSGVLVNPEIRDNYVYLNKRLNTFVFCFSIFHTIAEQEKHVSDIVFEINNQIERDGVVENEQGEQVPIQTYFAANGSLSKAKVLDYGMPSIEECKSFFDLDDPFDGGELVLKNDLAKEWLLNSITFNSSKLGDNFEFVE